MKNWQGDAAIRPFQRWGQVLFWLLTYLILQSPVSATIDDPTQIDPKHRYQISFLLKKGVFYTQQQNFEQAIKVYNKALSLDPYLIDPMFGLSEVYLATGDTAASKQWLRDVLAIEPNFPEAFLRLGLVFVAERDLEEAIAIFEEGLESNPEYAKLYFARGIARNEQGEKETALADFGKALSLKPDFPEAYYFAGTVYADLGDKLRAIERIKRAIQLEPSYPDAYNLLGILYLDEGELEKGLEQYFKALAINPHYATAYYNIACYFAKYKNDADQATFWLGQAMELGKEWADYAKSDADFDSIRHSPDFQGLVE